MSRSIFAPPQSSDPLEVLRWFSKFFEQLRLLAGPRYVWIRMSFDPVRHIRCSKPSPTKYGNVPPLGGSWSTEGPRSNYVVIAPWLHDDDVVDVNDPRVKELFELYCPFRVNQPPKLGSAL